MSNQKTEIIDLTFLGTDNHRATHGHLLTFSYERLNEKLRSQRTEGGNQTQDDKTSRTFRGNEDDEAFIPNSSIQMRLFDGIGCQGTEKNPRPGNYTWDNNFKKTVKNQNEIISHHLAKVTGEGMQALLEEADDYIKFIIQKNGGTLPKTINLKGYSRGADACIRLANRIYEKYPQIKINMFLVDPVPGPFHRDDDGSYIIPGNVQRLDVTLMKDEKIRFYKPQHMGRLVTQNPLTTKVTEHYLEGVHGAGLCIDQNMKIDDQKPSSQENTKENLIQFILDTSKVHIDLPTCYRNRSLDFANQFSYIDISSEHQITNLTKENKNIPDKKASFLNPQWLYHQRRTLVQEMHDEFTKKFESTQSIELKFYMKQFRDAQNFYHYHFPYHNKKHTTFETLRHSLLRIRDILLGKSMEEKTKIWPDHYATLLMQEALQYEPEDEIAAELKKNDKFKELMQNCIEKLSANLDQEQFQQLSTETNFYKKYQSTKNIYNTLKNETKHKKQHDPIYVNILPGTPGILTNEDITILDKQIDALEQCLCPEKEKLRIKKFQSALQNIKKNLTNSKFFHTNLKTYEEYQKQFILEVDGYLPDTDQSENQDFISLSLEEKFKIAQNTLKALIDKETDTKKLHQLYAIGQPPYIQPFMLSERRKEQKSTERIDIHLSRRM